MGPKFPPPECRSKIFDFFDGLYWRVTTLFALPATPSCFEIHFDDGEYQVAECAPDQSAEPGFQLQTTYHPSLFATSLALRLGISS